MPTDAGTVTVTVADSGADALAESATDVWVCQPYASEEGVFQTGTATNTGASTAYPRVTVTGPGVNPGIVNETTGDEMLWGTDPNDPLILTDTDTLVANCRTRRVSLNGTSAPTPNGWLTLQPGANTLTVRCAAPESGFSFDLEWDNVWG